MSKESVLGYPCACGLRVTFPTYHWPRCRANPANMSAAIKKELPFTKAELAKVAAHGPQPDKPIGKRRSNKANTSKAKRMHRGNSHAKGK